MISALAVGGRVLGEPRYVDAAARAADFLLDQHARRATAHPARPGRTGAAAAQGFLEDQAFVVAGPARSVRGHASTARWLSEALALAEALETHFADPERGGWFMTAGDAEALIAREKPPYDGAEPSGTSVALLNALRLHTFTDDDRWREVADRGFASVAERAGRPARWRLTEGLLALDYRLDVPREIAVVHPPGVSAETLAEVARTTFVPSKALVVAPEGSELRVADPVAGGQAGRQRPAHGVRLRTRHLRAAHRGSRDLAPAAEPDAAVSAPVGRSIVGRLPVGAAGGVGLDRSFAVGQTL